MKYYLIDHENAKSAGLAGVKELSSDDKVILFYTDKSNTLPIEFFEVSKSINVEFIKVPTGSESLDKHLIAHISYLLGTTSKDDYFIIVSRDKGYNPICSYLNALSNGNRVFQYSSIEMYLQNVSIDDKEEDEVQIDIVPLDDEISKDIEKKEENVDHENEDLKLLLDSSFPKKDARGAYSAYRKYKSTKDFDKKIKSIIHKRKNIDSKYKKDIINVLINYHNDLIKDELPF